MLWLATAIGVGVMTLVHTAPFRFLLEYVGSDRSIWRGPRSEGAPTVYLTYDDGPNPEATPALLDVLAREGVQATFFVIPRHVSAVTAPIVARIAREGHVVALHSHTRALMLQRPDRLASLLEAQAGRIEALTGVRPCRLFRPHAGWRGGAMYAGLDRAGYTLVGWSFGMWDFDWWRAASPDRLTTRLAARASDGSIIVMHDGHHEDPRADRRHTVAATAGLVATLKERGFLFGRLCASE
jgi:peptidoglycan/xylan/chitin deacetylase (PgdA/CDA1 family)